MKSTHRILSACIGLAAGSALAAIATPAQAFSFNDGTDLGTCAPILGGAKLASCVTDDGFTLAVTANGEQNNPNAALVSKTVGGVTGVGVWADESKVAGSATEIDFGEEITASLASAQIIQSIDLAFLYQNGVYGDKAFEIAQVTAGGKVGKLSVTGDLTAKWEWDGSVLYNPIDALSASLEGHGGHYRITDPFAGLAVSEIKFTSPTGEGCSGNCGEFSDFSIAGIATQGVPEPTALLGLGVVGAAAFGLRRRDR